MIHVGCCGFPGARHEYFAHFSLAEIQQTFYKLPRLATAQAWRACAPPEFEFALRASQLITHPSTSPTYGRARVKVEDVDRFGSFRPTAQAGDTRARTRSIADALQARFVVFQCPASFTPTEEHVADVRAFFGSVERGGLRFGWEPRGEWPNKRL